MEKRLINAALTRRISRDNGYVPIEYHPNLPPPPSAERLWRYVSFTKYLSLLDRRQLFFTNLEFLAHTDPHEGLLAQPNYRHREWQGVESLTPAEWEELRMEGMTPQEREVHFWSTKNSREYWLKRRFYDRRALFINCWHSNDYESAAMWSGYASANEGVAIASNYGRVARALADAPERLFAAKVEYLDFGKARVNNTLMFPLNKRMSFSHENEFRLIYWDMDIQEQLNELCKKISLFHGAGRPKRTDQIDWNIIDDDVSRIAYPSGRYINVALESLIEEVRVSPTSPDWFLQLVESVSERYSITAKVVRSDLMSSPIR